MNGLEMMQQPQTDGQAAGQTNEQSLQINPDAQNMHKELSQTLAERSAAYSQLKESQQRLGAVRGELDKLMVLGDTIDQSDVIKATGKLVGSGFSPRALAGMLADMPDSHEAIQAWVKNIDGNVQTMEAANAQALNVARQSMGVAAVRSLIGHAAAPAGDEIPEQGQNPAESMESSVDNPLIMGGQNAG